QMQESSRNRQVEAERKCEEVCRHGDRAVSEDARDLSMETAREAGGAHDGHARARRGTGHSTSLSAPQTVSTSSSRMVVKKGSARQLSPAASATGKSPGRKPNRAR